MSSRRPALNSGRSLPPKKALEILTKQIADAEVLRGEPWASKERTQWRDTALGALERAGVSKSLLDSFEAEQAFGMSSDETDEQLREQANSMLSGMVAVLRSAVDQLRWELGEGEELAIPEKPNANEPSVLIFISHSGKDVELASALIELLRAGLGLSAADIRCSSVDGYRLPGGAHTESQLRREVNTARAFIGLITQTSLASTYVMFELGARWGANLHMLPLLAGVDSGYIRGPLSGINALSGSNESQLHQLLSDIAKVLDIKVQDAPGHVRYVKRLAELCSRNRAIVADAQAQAIAPLQQRVSELEQVLRQSGPVADVRRIGYTIELETDWSKIPGELGKLIPYARDFGLDVAFSIADIINDLAGRISAGTPISSIRSFTGVLREILPFSSHEAFRPATREITENAQGLIKRVVNIESRIAHDAASRLKKPEIIEVSQIIIYECLHFAHTNRLSALEQHILGCVDALIASCRESQDSDVNECAELLTFSRSHALLSEEEREALNRSIMKQSSEGR